MKHRKKRSVGLIMAGVMTAGLLAGCGSAATVGKADERLRIVTTIYPEYNWVQNILGDNPADIQLSQLLDNGADLHSYQPTAAAMLTVSDCDLFVYLGGTSDAWVADALRQGTNPDRNALNLMETLGERAKEEELVEGMQGDEHDHEHEDDHDEDEHDAVHEDDHDHHEDEVEYDEHIWLSLKNADHLCEALVEQIAALDPENAALYRQNGDAYRAKLAALDTEYQAAVTAAPKNVLLFGDRFPFRYLVDDYGLDYYAAFVGCSAETEASFETVRFLAGKVDELGLNHVCVLENSDGKLANTIIQNSAAGPDKVSLVIFDSMQSATTRDEATGGDYLARMEHNLQALKTALS